MEKTCQKKLEEWEPLMMNQVEQSEQEPKLREITQRSGIVING